MRDHYEAGVMGQAYAPTALIVDDNFYNRDLCILALKHVGYTVTEAANGVEAMKLLQEGSYDLLVLDLAMPELNGVEVIQKLRAEPNHREMTIMVMTANPHMATTEVELTADFIMHKPIAIEEFARLAQRLAQAVVRNHTDTAGA
jgi:CheY-like chemotaxis protein